MNDSNVAKDYDEYKAQGRVWGQVPRERIKKIRFPRTPKAVVDRYLALPDITTTVSDLLDDFGVNGVIAASHLQPRLPGKKMVGNAVTLRSIPERKTPTKGVVDKEPIKMSTREAYALSEPGDVLVSDFGGNPDVSNMGGQSALVAKSAGFVGAIVNGAVRDLPAIRDIEFPVWSIGVTPVTGKFRIEAIEINGPVSMRGVLVLPGDLVVADDSGVCIVPYDLVIPLIEQAEKIGNDEDQMREMIKRGASLDELRPFFRKRYNN